MKRMILFLISLALMSVFFNTCSGQNSDEDKKKANALFIMMALNQNSTLTGTGVYELKAAVTGLIGTLVLKNEGNGDILTITTTEASNNANYIFPKKLRKDEKWIISIEKNPTNQTCIVQDNSSNGTAGLTAGLTAEVTCTTKPAYTLGGTVSGLTGTLVLTNSGVDKTITANGSYTFDAPINSGSSYTVTVKTQPTGQKCTVSNITGTISANVSNVDVSCDDDVPCNGGTETYDWGTFTDMCDGTVKFEGVAGEFGGVSYSAVTLYFEKCTHGQTHNKTNNNCQDSGNIGDNYSATKVSVCTNNSVFTNAGCYGENKILNGSGTSAAYSACNNKGTGNFTNWRVPTKAELKLLIKCTEGSIPNDSSNCTGSSSPAIVSLFTETIGDKYWTSEYGYTAGSDAKYQVNFNNGRADVSSGTTEYYLRCVRSNN